MLLERGKFKHLIDQFNTDDNEIVVNAIPNSEAWEWLEEQIPFFECPDSELEAVYYFRWWTYRKHIRNTLDGFVVTEFLPDVSWAGRHNTISCAAGHHIYEGRWLKDQRYMQDYSRFWFRAGGEPRRYSFWAADAIFAHYLLTGDAAVVLELLPDLVENYRCWEEGWTSDFKWGNSEPRLDPCGLFWQLDGIEGMEFSIGGHGLRPTINSYMYGDAVVISRVARMAGRNDLAERFAAKAAGLKAGVQQRLWDPQARFFKTLVNDVGARPHYSWQEVAPRVFKSGEMADVRELLGYVPWYFNLPDPGYEDAWTQLFDPAGFAAPFGPTTAERRHPGFMYPCTHECLWNGPSWPFATTQTLVALANLLNNYPPCAVGKADYLALLGTYARSHRLTRDDGRTIRWIDENLDPFSGEWLSRNILKSRSKDEFPERGRCYNHSGYCDLVISGLIGLRPRQDSIVEINPLIPNNSWSYFCLDGVHYHGKRLTIGFDADGTRYGHGKGMFVFADGEEIGRSPVPGKMLIEGNEFCKKLN